MRHLVFFLIISFLLTTVGSIALAQKAPETLEEARTIGERILWGFPEVFRGLWQEAIEIWGTMLNWFKNIWDSYIYPWLWNILGKEIEKRKPEIKEEFEKEKQEMKGGIKGELPKVGKSLWQRLKELIY